MKLAKPEKVSLQSESLADKVRYFVKRLFANQLI